MKKQVLELFIHRDFAKSLGKWGRADIITAKKNEGSMRRDERLKCTITIEVPEKVITLTESQFDEAVSPFKQRIRMPYSAHEVDAVSVKLIKESLFKDAKLEDLNAKGVPQEPKNGYDTVTESPRRKCESLLDTVERVHKEHMEFLNKASNGVSLADAAIIDRERLERLLDSNGVSKSTIRDVFDQFYAVKFKC